MEQDRLEVFMSLVGSASKSITKIKSRKMVLYGLGSTHTTCIRVLYAAADGLTRRQISEKCDLDKAQISRVIGELFEKEYVTEKPGASSYRKKIVLTKQGIEIAEDINRIVLDINNFVSGDISDEEIKTFYSVFRRICYGLKKAEEYMDSHTQK